MPPYSRGKIKNLTAVHLVLESGSVRAPFRPLKSDPEPLRWTHGSPHPGYRSSHDPLSFAQARQAIPP